MLLPILLLAFLCASTGCGSGMSGGSGGNPITVNGTYTGTISVNGTSMGVTAVLSESTSGSISGNAAMTNTNSCQVPSSSLPIVAGSVTGDVIGFTVDDQWTFQGTVTDNTGRVIQGQFNFARPCSGLPFPLPAFPLTLTRQP